MSWLHAQWLEPIWRVYSWVQFGKVFKYHRWYLRQIPHTRSYYIICSYYNRLRDVKCLLLRISNISCSITYFLLVKRRFGVTFKMWDLRRSSLHQTVLLDATSEKSFWPLTSSAPKWYCNGGDALFVKWWSVFVLAKLLHAWIRKIINFKTKWLSYYFLIPPSRLLIKELFFYILSQGGPNCWKGE